MIILFNPRATRPRNRRLPLAILAIAAVLEGREEYEIVYGNLDDHTIDIILKLIDTHDVELMGVSVMPGPQKVSTMEAFREVRRWYPQVQIVWCEYLSIVFLVS